MFSQKIKKYLKKQKKSHQLKIKIVKLSDINKWEFNNSNICHKSKKFFKIVGIKVRTNFNKRNWDQPIIVPYELGILGIIKNIKTKKYLLQAKVEPGNINKLQLAPTVQATKSNYSQAHGGKKVRRHEQEDVQGAGAPAVGRARQHAAQGGVVGGLLGAARV